jgi:5'-deoxynucleotidase YfbR-like HD superfamily hydrolase
MLDKITLELTPKMIDQAIKDSSLEDLLEGVHSPGYPDRLGHYTFTHSGRIFFPCDPRPEEVFIEDLAVGGSRVYRFNGQSIMGMTINEHEIHASYLTPRKFALEALMHDSPESIIGDLIRPMKALPCYGTMYLKIEDRIARAIAERFSLVYPWPKEVRIADEILGHTEVAQNIASKEDAVHYDKKVYDRAKEKPRHFDFQYWSPEIAKTIWLSRFRELAAERGITVH